MIILSKAKSLNQKINFVVRFLFILAFIETIVFAVWTKDFQNTINAFTAILGFVLTFIPEAVESISKNKIRFSSGMKIAICLFIFGAEMLGEINSFYERFTWWDNFLHSFSGLILGAIGFMIVYAMNEAEVVKVKLSPIFIAAFAFFFALACGALWEIFEFSGDRLLSMNMQKYLPPANQTALISDSWRYDAGLIDTMTDIILDAASAFIVSALGYVKLKREKGA